jgi:hypothetical protein
LLRHGVWVRLSIAGNEGGLLDRRTADHDRAAARRASTRAGSGRDRQPNCADQDRNNPTHIHAHGNLQRSGGIASKRHASWPPGESFTDGEARI